ncbi:unnamed protein product [Rhizophagus irregularis]|nr:unnamed protein product [Rhizophagus irregularis]
MVVCLKVANKSLDNKVILCYSAILCHSSEYSPNFEKVSTKSTLQSPIVFFRILRPTKNCKVNKKKLY